MGDVKDKVQEQLIDLWKPEVISWSSYIDSKICAILSQIGQKRIVVPGELLSDCVQVEASKFAAEAAQAELQNNKVVSLIRGQSQAVRLKLASNM